jgi:hypothetical protein
MTERLTGKLTENELCKTSVTGKRSQHNRVRSTEIHLDLNGGYKIVNLCHKVLFVLPQHMTSE